MAADSEEQPTIRRGKGLRLSTGQPEDSAAPAPASPAPAVPSPADTPPTRRRGMRLSTPPPAAVSASAPNLSAEPLAEEVPVQGTTAAPEARPEGPLDPTHEPGPLGERWRIATARGPLSYLKSGQGRPLLLLHGFGATGRIWAPTAGAIAALSTCYALDMPGCGGSPPRTEAPTLPALADEVIAFADALGLERFDLLGHSLGAAVAAVVAGRHPGRVARLVVVSLGVRTFAPELAALGLSRAPLDLTFNLARPLLDFWQPVGRAVMQSPPLALSLGALVLHHPPASTEQWRGYLADHAATDPRGYVTSLAAPGDPALHEALGAIVAPTLCVAGREDKVARIAETTTAHQLLAGSRLEVIEGCGHMPMLERPADFQLALRQFLMA